MDLIIPIVALVILTLLTTLLFRFFFFDKNSQFNSKAQLSETERLLTKKYKEVDIHQHRKQTMVAAIFITLLFTVALIEYGRKLVEEEEIVKVSVEDVFDETLDIPPTTQELPPPPPVVVKTSIVLKETEEDLIEELEIPQDTIPEDDEISYEEEEGEEDDEEEEYVPPVVYEFVEVEAVPHNGDLFTYSEYIFSKINKGAIKSDMEAGLKGFLEIEMIVLENGDLSNFRTTSSVGPSIDKEITRILHQAPAWTPARMQGQVVRQKVLFQMMIDY
jgi:protein TonB